MAEDTEKKDDKKKPPTQGGEPPTQGGELTVPGEATLPIEALLSMPPPAAPRTEMPAALTAEDLALLAQEGATLEEPAPSVEPAPQEEPADGARGQRLREALQGAPETINTVRRLTPRNLAKDTVGRGIDAALEAGGLRTPTRPPEDS